MQPSVYPVYVNACGEIGSIIQDSQVNGDLVNERRGLGKPSLCLPSLGNEKCYSGGKLTVFLLVSFATEGSRVCRVLLQTPALALGREILLWLQIQQEKINT